MNYAKLRVPSSVPSCRFPRRAASSEAKFLRGKFVFANWDVDELKARKERMETGSRADWLLPGFRRAYLEGLAWWNHSIEIGR